MIRMLDKSEFECFFELMGEVELGKHFRPDDAKHVAWLNRKIDRYFYIGAKFFGLFLDDNTPAGFTSLLINEKLFCPNNAEILDIGVFPKFRGQGFGSELFKYAEKLAQGASVYCLFSRTYAADYKVLSFYGRNGYVPVAVMPDLNGPNDEGEIFVRKLL
ncbi:MAG: hypothetical protein CVT49_06145 [candidate division Zixibacteria bacterium HGW-Zixibacteria-1]|nr:MAG: hypothetical protein CVT49_06145 [candidate division Zixibacteria bacterium HGW-Zixibacteria-1]